jgi:fumarylacetoacetate (FAA) hydrolase
MEMKLATLKDGSRDGRLVIVSRDLTRFTDASFLAPNMRAAMDDWARLSPHLAALSESLDHGSVPSDRFHEHDAMSPLPRTNLWADGSAYLSHVELVRKARGQPLPENFQTDPLMYVGAGDAIIGPRDPITAVSEAWGIDLEGEVAVITGDVAAGASREEALAQVRLIMLVNDISFRMLAAQELKKGFGFCQSKGPTAFSPVAVTPDELGDRWSGGKLHMPLLAGVNGRPVGRADAGKDMQFDFGQLVAHAARTRGIAAGAIIGSGTVSNRGADGAFSRPVAEGGAGFSCLAEQRMWESQDGSKPRTPLLNFGDTVRIEMKDDHNHTVFGAIEQVVEQAAR